MSSWYKRLTPDHNGITFGLINTCQVLRSPTSHVILTTVVFEITFIIDVVKQGRLHLV